MFFLCNVVSTQVIQSTASGLAATDLAQANVQCHDTFYNWHQQCCNNVMTHKQHTIAMQKPWPHAGSLGLHLREIIANLRRIVEIPTGYQDETGFHYGVEQAKENPTPPQI